MTTPAAKYSVPTQFVAVATEVATTLRTTLANVWGRMSGLGIGEVCGRCHGSGHYSRNYHGQTHCYQCNGAQVTAPRSAKAWTQALAEANDAAANGTLDRYIANLEARAATKKASDKLMKAWHAAGVDECSSWEVASRCARAYKEGKTPSAEMIYHLEVANINDKMYNASKGLEAAETAVRLASTREERWAAYTAMSKALTDGLAAIEAATQELNAFLAIPENAAFKARYITDRRAVSRDSMAVMGWVETSNGFVSPMDR